MECIMKKFLFKAYAAMCAMLVASAIPIQAAGDYQVVHSKKSFSLGKTLAQTVQNPVIGSFAGLVVLIDFPDQKSDISVTAVDSFLNGTTYSGYGDNGSIAGYYRYVSQGRLNLKLITSPKYYRAKYTYSYYDSLGHCDDLLQEALTWIDTLHGIDIAKVTMTSDSTIKSLNFFYAGTVHSVGAQGLWGHSAGHEYTFKNYYGIHTGPYCIAELGEQMRLGGLCHEMGHQLCGFPDLYDTHGKSNGCGRYCLMAFGNSDPYDGAGSRNPIPINPYFRYLRGWNDMTDLYGTSGGSRITLTTDSLNTSCYRNPDKPGEMFIIEARDTLGHYNNCPGQGVLIWHVDSTVYPDNGSGGNDAETRPQRTADQHYLLSVVQADGRFDLENNNYYGHDADFFKLGGSLDHFASSTNPANTWWDGSASGFEVSGISGLGRTMSFTLGTANSYVVHASSTLGGTVSPKGIFYIASGGSKTFSVNLANSFAVESCLVNNSSLGNQSSYTITNLSKNSEIQFITIRNSDNLGNPVNGLKYSTFIGDTALFQGNIPDYNTMKVHDTGSISTLSLAKRPQDQYFGMRFSGWLRVPTDGMWNFGLASDDGSRFSIGGIAIVNNDGQHGTDDTIKGSIRLQAGYHPYVLDYLQGQAGYELDMFMSGPGVSWRTVANSDFFIGKLQPSLVTNVAISSAVLQTRMHGSCLVLKNIGAGMKIDLTSLSGRRILSRSFTITENTANIDMSGFAEGVYIWRVATQSGQIVKQEMVKLVR